jgi:glycosyltransferase involved in cell wall biosynthesis
MHNRHASRGGADEVLDLERSLLKGAGHRVDQLTVAPAGSSGHVRAAAHAVWNRQVAGELVARIESFRPDIVHVHTPFPTMSPAVFGTAHRGGVATVTTCHGYRYSCVAGTLRRAGTTCEACVGRRVKLPGLRHGCYHGSRLASLPLTASLAVHTLIGTFEREIDRFIALTEFGRKVLIRDGIPADRIAVKPNAVPDPGEPPSGYMPVQAAEPAQPYVAFAGRLVEEKGLHTLLAAARQMPQVRVVIAGDGALRPEVESAAARLSNVEYLGWLEESTVTELLRGARATVVPSEWFEAQPLTLLRSLSVGTPVICSDLENVSASVIAHRAGRAFVTGDERSLAEAVTSALDERRWLADTGQNARRLYLREHTPEATLRCLENIYEAAIRTHRESGGRHR